MRFKSNKATPWYDSDLRHLHHVKMTSWRKARRTKKTPDSAKFKQLRNQLKKLSNKYNNFVNDLSDNMITNPERFWTFFRKKEKQSHFQKLFFMDHKNVVVHEKKLNLFNQYFKSNFADDDSTTNPHSYSVSDTNYNLKNDLSNFYNKVC